GGRTAHPSARWHRPGGTGENGRDLNRPRVPSDRRRAAKTSLTDPIPVPGSSSAPARRRWPDLLRSRDTHFDAAALARSRLRAVIARQRSTTPTPTPARRARRLLEHVVT